MGSSFPSPWALEATPLGPQGTIAQSAFVWAGVCELEHISQIYADGPANKDTNNFENRWPFIYSPNVYWTRAGCQELGMQWWASSLGSRLCHCLFLHRPWEREGWDHAGWAWASLVVDHFLLWKGKGMSLHRSIQVLPFPVWPFGKAVSLSVCPFGS